MINQPKQKLDYADREIDCQEAMEAGFQAIVNCMLEAGWQRSEVMRSLRCLIAADNVTQKENAKVEAEFGNSEGDDSLGKGTLKRWETSPFECARLFQQERIFIDSRCP
ncbi:hypothetical protein [Mesorhizobium sp. WSM3224]|uniref:hypothetical protein n=1 Tax=Mesorhizobium sp. WSM3224 TaxID=1040986 RepID=UPI0004114B22|nr:hypothetical protein [Mesorhizobium sp. WSM3224]